jgi:transcriptional regulator with XRE-family HTH domain
MVPGWARRVPSRLGGRTVDIVPHIVLAAYLVSQRMLTEVASVRWDVPLEVIHALMRGGYPEDTAHLARIGRSIQADAESWGWALAAGLCRLSRADAERCLRGRLWRWLIREELGIAEAARRHGITTRSLRLALSDTAVTGSLRQSGILAAVEWSDEREAVRERPEAVELRQLVGAAMAKGGWTRRRLSAEIGASRASIAALTRGQVPRVLNPLWVRPLARALGIDPERFAHLLAALWRTRGSNRGALRYLVMRHCFARGIPIAALAERAGMSHYQMRHLLAERCQPDEATGAALARELGVDAEAWAAALARHRARAQASSISCDSLTTAPLHELVLAAAGASGVDPATWARRNRLSAGTIERVVRWHRQPRLACVQGMLRLALGIDAVVYRAAVRGMYESPATGIGDYRHLDPRSPLQGRLLALAGGSHAGMQRLARAIRISPRCCDRLLRGGILDLRPRVREKVRLYLGLDVATFTRETTERAEPPEAAEVDDEVRLLRMFRALSPERQKWLVGLANGASA